MAIFRGAGGPGDATTDAANEASVASTKAVEAAASATAAASSASAAATSETNAATSASNAETSKNEAETAKIAAELAETNAETAQTAAETAQAAAELAETNAETAQTAAETAQTAAELAETNAETAQTAAETAQTAAELAETNAETAETNAETAETNAASSATAAASSATSAASSATAAALSESSASTSASNASTSETNAGTSETNAATSATNAASSATAASQSATSAATSASNASTSENAAQTYASNALTYSNNASTSETNAASSATSAAASYDSFDDRYLGAKSSAPTLDNDGDALLTGALYWNTGSNQLFIWSGSAWDQAAFSTSGSVTSFNTRTGAVTLNSTDVTDVGALMDSELTSEASVKALDQGVATTDSPSFAGLTVDTNTLYVDSTNNRVGIGTASPVEVLHIKSDDATIRLEHNADPSYFSTFIQSGNSLYISAHTFRIRNEAGTENIRITNTGKVGIGTSSPSSTLTVSDGTTSGISPFANTDLFLDSSGSNYLQFGSGSASAASIYFGDSADGDAGAVIYNHSSDYMSFRANAAERMRIDSSGNVGIGTSSPNENLSVIGQGRYFSASTSAFSRVSVAEPQSTYTTNFRNTTLSYYPVDTTGTTYGISSSNLGALQFINTNNALIGTNGGSPLIFATNSAERMRITSAGNVGIGTSNPADPLHVEGKGRFVGAGSFEALELITSDNNRVYITGNSSATGDMWRIGTSTSNSNLNIDALQATSNVLFRLNGTERMRITSGGNVGIGTTSPTGKLNVYSGDSGATTDGSADELFLEQAGNSGLTIGTPNTSTASIFFADPESSSAGRIQYLHTSDSLTFGTAAAERMRITSAGNVGIGTTSPSELLEVYGADPFITIVNTSETLGGIKFADAQAVSTQNAVLAFDSGGNSLEFSINNTERMRIDSSGNVGIGTATPEGRLQANAVSAFDPAIIVRSDASVSNWARMDWKNSNVAQTGIIYLNNSGLFSIRNDGASPIAFYTNGANERMRITSTGNVGIGTSLPAQILEVKELDQTGFTGIRVNNPTGNIGSAGIEFQVDATYSKAAIYQTRKNPNGNGDLIFAVDSASDAANWAASDEKMRINSSGNVGIGTSSPGTALDVNGITRTANAYSLSYAGVPGSTSAFGAGTISADANWGMYFKATTGAAIADFAWVNGAGTERMRIDTSGNLKFNSGYGSVATAYGCRAWVNFNGTGTVAIRASGNVSSITDNGTGDYTVNFTTAMPDANYTANVIAQRLNDKNTRGNVGFQATYSSNKTTSILRVTSTDSGFTLVDSAMVDVAVFR